MLYLIPYHQTATLNGQLTRFGTTLQAQLQVPLRAVDAVRPGTSVRFHYLDYPHQEFGFYYGQVSGTGELLAVSPLGPRYLVPLALAKDSVEAYGRTLPLQAGMRLQAEITLSKQSLLQWLLSRTANQGQR